jgi:hypothetical protein
VKLNKLLILALSPILFLGCQATQRASEPPAAVTASPSNGRLTISGSATPRVPAQAVAEEMQKPVVYKTFCVPSMDSFEKDGSGHPLSKSWDRQFEIRGIEIAIVLTYYLDNECRSANRKHVYVGEIIDGNNPQEKLMWLPSGFVIKQGQLSLEAQQKITATSIEPEEIVPRVVDEIVGNGQGDLVIYKIEKFLARSRLKQHVLRNPVMMFSISLNNQTITYLQHEMHLQP